MNVPWLNQTASAMSTTLAAPSIEAAEHKLGHLLYQAATLAAILLFLISFWSC